MPFTELQIKRLKPRMDRYDMTETGVSPDRRGLQVRVYPSGSKTWLFRYAFEGKTSRVRLGSFPHLGLEGAHKRQQECRDLLKSGINPRLYEQIQLKQRQEAPTVDLLYIDFRDHYLRRKRKRPEQAEQALEKHLIPYMGELKAEDVNRRQIIERIRDIEESGAPRMAEVVKALISQMFRYGVDVGLVNSSPAVALPMIGSKGKVRERILTEPEIRKFWKRLDKAALDQPMRNAYRLLLVTGQRRGEVAGARWDEINRRSKKWTIPAERSKNGKPHEVPLTPLALKLLDSLKNDSDWILPSPIHPGPIYPQSLSRGMSNNRELFKIAHFTCHDLRRTAASYMTSLGILRLHVSKVLNHSDQSLAAIYDQHDYAPEKRQALTVWSNHLKAILHGTATKISILKTA